MYEIFVYFQGKIVILIRFIFLMECKKDEKSDFFVFLKKKCEITLAFWEDFDTSKIDFIFYTLARWHKNCFKWVMLSLSL